MFKRARGQIFLSFNELQLCPERHKSHWKILSTEANNMSELFLKLPLAASQEQILERQGQDQEEQSGDYCSDPKEREWWVKPGQL